ncbi:hypothetical protein F53441_11663 [Fusarium austroafricanum]|uniref:Uncharacterized protein n=1 Tax=Fusarium austroafricanum TaxID=2364996 RepID=A0A8H4K339_9HYPO|nr:hypothetical protein F53441_11663 [Fusarium austroafricanum]
MKKTTSISSGSHEYDQVTPEKIEEGRKRVEAETAKKRKEEEEEKRKEEATERTEHQRTKKSVKQGRPTVNSLNYSSP